MERTSRSMPNPEKPDLNAGKELDLPPPKRSKKVGEAAVSSVAETGESTVPDRNGSEEVELPAVVIGSGQPFTYEVALEIHKRIRRAGLGLAQVPPRESTQPEKKLA